jgi:energy-coupling factor transport system ATP-binding protein
VLQSLDTIAFENVTINFHPSRSLFNKLNFRVKKSSLNLLLGPTGSGKTTILRLIKGIIPYLNNNINIKGKIYINGEMKTDLTYFKQSIEIGYLFQDFDLQFIGSTVEKELAFQLENMGIPSLDISQRIQWYSDNFSLSNLLHRPPHSLSGGELAKVEFISTVIPDPSIILLDEPLANLDHTSKTTILEVLKEFYGKYTIIISTHDFIPFIDLVDSIFVINKGQIICYSDVQSFLKDGNKFEWLNISELARNYYLRWGFGK